MRRHACSIVFAAASCVAASASIAQVSGYVTADNHYALFAKIGGVVTFVGANESGSGGSPGAYNWSVAESWTITNATDLYIAAWSDKAVAQGVLATFQVNNQPLHSGDASWRVISTGVTLGDGSPPPAASQVASFVDAANAGNLWQNPYIGGINGVAPWGGIANISTDARWMWATPTASRSNTITGGWNYDEYLIFHAPVPAAPTASVFVAGALLIARRKR